MLQIDFAARDIMRWRHCAIDYDGVARAGSTREILAVWPRLLAGLQRRIDSSRSPRTVCCREREVKCGSLAQSFGFDPNVAAITLNNLLANGKSQTRTGVLFG